MVDRFLETDDVNEKQILQESILLLASEIRNVFPPDRHMGNMMERLRWVCRNLRLKFPQYVSSELRREEIFKTYFAANFDLVCFEIDDLTTRFAILLHKALRRIKSGNMTSWEITDSLMGIATMKKISIDEMYQFTDSFAMGRAVALNFVSSLPLKISLSDEVVGGLVGTFADGEKFNSFCDGFRSIISLSSIQLARITPAELTEILSA